MKKPGKEKKDLNPIDPSKITDHPGIIQFPHHIGSAVIKPEDRGRIKGRAMSAMQQQTEKQMNMLFEQMQLLARQVNELKKRVEVSEKIYMAQINFEPVIGHLYYIYHKNNNTDVLSMIGPEEWGNNLPYESYLATVRLLPDHTWEVLDKNEDADDVRQ